MNSGEAQIPSQATVFRPTATYVHEAINGRFFVRRGNGEFLAQALIAVDEEHEVELRKEGVCACPRGAPRRTVLLFSKGRAMDEASVSTPSAY